MSETPDIYKVFHALHGKLVEYVPQLALTCKEFYPYRPLYADSMIAPPGRLASCLKQRTLATDEVTVRNFKDHVFESTPRLEKLLWKVDVTEVREATLEKDWQWPTCMRRVEFTIAKFTDQRLGDEVDALARLALDEVHLKFTWPSQDSLVNTLLFTAVDLEMFVRVFGEARGWRGLLTLCAEREMVACAEAMAEITDERRGTRMLYPFMRDDSDDCDDMSDYGGSDNGSEDFDGMFDGSEYDSDSDSEDEDDPLFAAAVPAYLM